MTYDEALDKVRKLLRLSKSSNPHEAANAAAKAQAIMDAHRLSSAMLDIETAGPVVPDEPILDFGQHGAPLDVARWRERWQINLASAVARANGCRIYGRGQSINLVGRRSDAETVRYLFAYLAPEIDRLAREAGRGMGRVWANNFRLGAVEAVSKRLREQRDTARAEARQSATNTAALVLVNRAIASVEARESTVATWMKENMRLSRSGGRGGRWDGSAREAGRIAGNGIALGGGARLSQGADRLGA